MNGLVVSAVGKARDWVLANLRTGSMVRLVARLSPVETEMRHLWDRAAYIVGGGLS
jgi:hypothetical protein